MQGYLYVLSNPSMPGIVKIGRTERDPAERVVELSGETGVPSPFELEFSVLSQDIETLERGLHERFAKYRVSPNREFFRLPVASIKIAVEEIKTAIHETTLSNVVAHLLTFTDDELCQIVDRVLMRRRAVKSFVFNQ